MTLFNILFLMISSGVFVLAAFFALQIVCALLPYKKQVIKPKPHADIAILIPAHNEEKGLAQTLTSLSPQLTDAGRLIVIADNCQDQTAEIARSLDAEVVVRQDENNRGKGFALSFGIEHLKARPPEIVIIIDADCIVHSGAIQALINTVQNTGRSAQALYLMNEGKTEKPAPSLSRGELSQKVSAFAFLLKNHIRLLGMKQLGLPCHLVGTGMAFPWTILSQAELATGNIVEDMQLGVDLVKQGQPAVFCPEALITSSFPDHQDALATQRTRWEHGHLQTILTQVPGLVLSGMKDLKFSRLLFALDLAIPPLTLFGFVSSLIFIFTLLWALISSCTLPLILSASGLLLLSASLSAAWVKHGRVILPAKDILSVFTYILKKIPVYVSFIFNRQKNWIRTDRK